MAKPNYISRADFQKVFDKALTKCNIRPEERESFFEEGSTIKLRNLGICIAITNIIDNIIKEELPDYDGCTSNEDFSTIYEWNKVFMYEREQARKREKES